MMRYSRPVFAYRALALVAALLACSGSEKGLTSPTTDSPAAIVITPDAPSLSIGSQIALQAAVHDANGQLVSGASIFWSSSDTNVVTVSSNGLVTGKSIGTAQVAASSTGQSALVPVSVVPVAVASVALLPSTASVIVGGTVSLQAVAYDGGGNTLSGRAFVWASSASQVATVDQSGKVTGVAAGTATITGTSEGKTASATITVAVVPVAAVTVAPTSASLTVGQTAALAGTATDANGNVLSGRQITWSSANSGVATVSAQGLVTAVGAGATTVTASSEGKSATAQVVVTSPVPVPVASVAITPSSTSLQIGGTTTLSATVRDASGATLSGRTVTWSSNASQVATVSSSGVVTAVATGSATITATSEGKTGTASVTVAPVPVASVTVSPSTATVAIHATVTLSSTERDANNATLSGRSVSWSSSAPQVATVSSSGVVTAVSAGAATITATSEGRSGSATITVPSPPPPPPAPVATVKVSPATLTIHRNQTATLTAQVLDADGNSLTDRTVTWSSSDNSKVTVTGSGTSVVITIHNHTGPATVSATSEGKTGSASITIN